MTDFSKPYRNVPFFGLWAEQGTDRQGKAAALAVLESARDRCIEEDVRQNAEVKAALEWLSR